MLENLGWQSLQNQCSNAKLNMVYRLQNYLRPCLHTHTICLLLASYLNQYMRSQPVLSGVMLPVCDTDTYRGLQPLLSVWYSPVEPTIRRPCHSPFVGSLRRVNRGRLSTNWTYCFYWLLRLLYCASQGLFLSAFKSIHTVLHKAL